MFLRSFFFSHCVHCLSEFFKGKYIDIHINGCEVYTLVSLLPPPLLILCTIDIQLWRRSNFSTSFVHLMILIHLPASVAFVLMSRYECDRRNN